MTFKGLQRDVIDSSMPTDLLGTNSLKKMSVKTHWPLYIKTVEKVMSHLLTQYYTSMVLLVNPAKHLWSKFSCFFIISPRI